VHFNQHPANVWTQAVELIMFKFPWFTKRPQNNQSPGAIPGFLFRDGREEDDFVIIGETDSNEVRIN